MSLYRQALCHSRQCILAVGHDGKHRRRARLSTFLRERP